MSVLLLVHVVRLHDADASSRDVPEAHVEPSEVVSKREVDALGDFALNTLIDEFGGVQSKGIRAPVGLKDVGSHDRAVESLDLLEYVSFRQIRDSLYFLQKSFILRELGGLQLGVEVFEQLLRNWQLVHEVVVDDALFGALDDLVSQRIDGVAVAVVVSQLFVELLQVEHLVGVELVSNVDCSHELGHLFDRELSRVQVLQEETLFRDETQVE